MRQNDPSTVRVIGLTGGVGSGKSSVAYLLERDYHAFLLIADEIARDLMQPGQISYKQIVDYFGPEVILPDGQLDRAKLSDLVFDKPEELAKLNSFVHPHVVGVILEAIALLKESGEYPYIVVESAILFDVKYEAFCDEVWYVYANETVRRQRLMENRGYSVEKIESIEKNQRPHEDFLMRSDVAIDNSGDMEALEKRIAEAICGSNAPEDMI
ncbi:MAG: dephospho-CoA kinase [Lachnospiraceae bacterium]|nr:dephospho-CoA kinase [Lachnospiraceae bacterium]